MMKVEAVLYVISHTTLGEGGCWLIAVVMRDASNAHSPKRPALSVRLPSVSRVRQCLSDPYLVPDQCHPLVFKLQFMVAQHLQVTLGDLR